MPNMRKNAYILSVVVASGAVLAQSVGDPTPFYENMSWDGHDFD